MDNRLVENANKILLSRLRRLCALDIDTVDLNDVDPDSIPHEQQDPTHAQANTARTPMGEKRATKERNRVEEANETDAEHHFTLSDIRRMQGYSQILTEAARRISRHDNKIHPVEFRKATCWSPPRVMTNRGLNSYHLVKLDRTELTGTVHARRIWRYIPQSGGKVAWTHRTQDTEEADREIREAEEDMSEELAALFNEMTREDA
ncbi:hypothetical protein JB92DRAFT_2833080 [Gautieria morchelliformis]|nr:hypothetical protein JB92DRAFT_2833080 [Gautieria morchelliformis]